MTGGATPCYWSDSQPTLNPDFWFSSIMRSQQCRDWCRRHMWSGNSGSSLLIRSLVISLIHPRHGSIISILNKDQFSPIGVGMNASPPTVLQNPIYNCPPLFFGVGRHPVDYFSFEGTKRWWVENGPRGVWTWSGPAWAAFREALWQTWREKQSTAIFCRCCGLHGVVCCWWLKHLNGGELAKDWEGFDLTTLGCICVGGVHGRSRVMLHRARNKVHKWRNKTILIDSAKSFERVFTDTRGSSSERLLLQNWLQKREFIAGQIHKASCVGSGHLRSPNNTEQWEWMTLLLWLLHKYAFPKTANTHNNFSPDFVFITFTKEEQCERSFC